MSHIGNASIRDTHSCYSVNQSYESNLKFCGTASLVIVKDTCDHVSHLVTARIKTPVKESSFGIYVVFFCLNPFHYFISRV